MFVRNLSGKFLAINVVEVQKHGGVIEAGKESNYYMWIVEYKRAFDFTDKQSAYMTMAALKIDKSEIEFFERPVYK